MHNGGYASSEELIYEDDGHYHLRVSAFYEFDSYANDIIDFIFDTGAFLTVISRVTAQEFGFLDRYTIQSDISLAGFSGECLADLKEIPGMVVGGRRLTGVKVAVPHLITDMDILGLNVIDHFKFFIDTEKDRIYFSENPKPEIPEMLKAKDIQVISPGGSEQCGKMGVGGKKVH
ncbi:MAG: retroviral-like aspartic protease family protein [Defluviitaleaceae bacterium]|nr:retroviral-like aspartic protease family protein [Defluviitaleaceae bacterium]MCL2263598.1 retroviral-like aspartic protease family protein [Defluviitaleaceae bacterium]